MGVTRDERDAERSDWFWAFAKRVKSVWKARTQSTVYVKRSYIRKVKGERDIRRGEDPAPTAIQAAERVRARRIRLEITLSRARA